MRDAVVLGEAGDLRVEGEAEDREQVDVLGVDRLARRLLDERRADGAVLRADRDRDPRRRIAVRLAVALSDRLDVLARVGLERRERDPLLPAAVLDAGLREVVEDRLLEVRRVGVLGGLGLGERLRAVAERERAVRAQRLDRERAGDADLLRVLERLVVEQLEVGVPLDRRVDLARGMPSLMSGLFAIDFSVMCWTRS